MGIATVTSGRIMKGQLQNSSGENTILAMDTFPYCGLSKVIIDVNLCVNLLNLIILMYVSKLDFF